MLVRMTCIYEPDDLTETRMELLAAVSTDSDLYLAKVASTTFYLEIWLFGFWHLSSYSQMPGNCRNISDEVFPGIHVGDK